MPKNKIEDLRNLLFETMEKLMDDDDPMDLERAEAIGKVGQVIVNSAKVEVDFLKQTGRGGASFLSGNSTPTPVPVQIAVAKPVLTIAADARHEDLCQQCVLPDCNETSDQCLVKIQRQAA